MEARTVRIVLEAVTAQYATGMRQAASEAKGLEKALQSNAAAANTVALGLGAAGAAALAFAGTAVKKFMDFDTAMSGVQAATRASAAEMQQLRDAAMTLGADTKFSASEAANGIEALGRAGVSTSEILGGGLAGALDLAAAGQMEVGDAAEVAAFALSQFNLRGKDVAHVADLLAAGAGKALGEVSDLADALKNGGLVASSFGISIEETTGTLAAFAEVGLIGGEAGTSLKSMLLALASPSKQAKKAMEEVGLAVYDASGKFIGLEALAGQLTSKLGHLTQEQRNATMSIIFGSYGVRAANILYEQGAEGIANWTAAVDDAGYAAEQAAILQDNLAGDLEKVGGAWDTLLIKMGESANGPLRWAAQSLDGLLTKAAEAPGLAAGLFALVTGFGAVAVGAAGLMKATVFVSEFRASLDALGLAGGKLSRLPGLIAGVGKAAGALGITLAAVQLVDWLDDIGTGAVRSGEDMRRFAENVAAGADRIDSAFRSIDGKAIATQWFGLSDAVHDLGSAIEQIDWDKAGWGGGSNYSYFGLIESDAGKAVKALNAVSDEIAAMPPMDAARAYSNILSEFASHGKDAAYASEFFGSYLGKVQDQLRAAGPSFAHLADNMEAVSRIAAGELPDGLVYTADGIMTTSAAIEAGISGWDRYGSEIIEAQAAHAQAVTALDLAEQGIDGVGKHAEMTTEALAGLRAGMEGQSITAEDVAAVLEEVDAAYAELVEGIAGASSAFVDLQGTIKGATDEAGFHLDTYLEQLEKSRQAQEQWQENLVQLAGRASAGLLQHLAEMGPAGAELVASLVTATDEQMAQMEVNFAASGKASNVAFAGNLLDATSLWPKIAAKAGSDAANAAVLEIARGGATAAEVAARYDIKYTVNADTAPAISAAEAARARIDRLVATIKVRADNSHVGIYHRAGLDAPVATGGRVGDVADALGLANGGTVRGPGTRTSDSVPALLSRDEFVIRAAAAEYYGPNFLYALNAMHVPRDVLPQYADGGQVGWERYAPGRSYSSTAPALTSTQTVHVTVKIPEAAAASGAGSARWLDDFAAQARRYGWEV